MLASPVWYEIAACIAFAVTSVARAVPNAVGDAPPAAAAPNPSACWVSPDERPAWLAKVSKRGDAAVEIWEAGELPALCTGRFAEIEEAEEYPVGGAGMAGGV